MSLSVTEGCPDTHEGGYLLDLLN